MEFERALQKGELVRIREGGQDFYAWKEITVDHTSGAKKRTSASSGSLQITGAELARVENEVDAHEVALESSSDRLALALTTPSGLAGSGVVASPFAASAASNPLPLADLGGFGSTLRPPAPLTPDLRDRLYKADDLSKKILGATKFANATTAPSSAVGQNLWLTFQDMLFVQRGLGL